MKRVCFIVNGYPTKEDPSYAFIQPIVFGFADLGYHCTVIAPQSLTKRIISHKKGRKYHWLDKSPAGNSVDVFQPQFISFSALRMFDINWSSFFRDIAIRRCYKKIKHQNDAIYAHFWDCAIPAGQIAKENNIPLYVASGESKIRVFDYYSNKKIEKYLNYIHGVIFVSTKNFNESKELGLLKYSPRTVVLPNAVDPQKFYIMPKMEARKKLGFDIDDKIAIFVGAFNNRKGVLRVVQAAEAVEGLNLILIGNGEDCPESEKILFKGKVPHDDLVTYLNSADVFILPTLAEGCCNAIVEALACGKPVISSNLPFNDDILNDDNSLRIDPLNICEITEALDNVFQNPKLKERLERGSIATGKLLIISKRIKKIAEFMENGD